MPKAFDLALAGLASLSLLTATGIAYAAEAEHVIEVADNIYTYAPGDGYISLFVVGSDSVAAIESVNGTHATGFLEAIQATTDGRSVKSRRSTSTGPSFRTRTVVSPLAARPM